MSGLIFFINHSYFITDEVWVMIRKGVSECLPFWIGPWQGLQVLGSNCLKKSPSWQHIIEGHLLALQLLHQQFEARNIPKKVLLIVRVWVCLLEAAWLCFHWVCYAVRHKSHLEMNIQVSNTTVCNCPLCSQVKLATYPLKYQSHRSDTAWFEVASPNCCRHWFAWDCSIWRGSGTGGH